MHLVHRRLEGALNECLQERASLRRNRIIFDEIPLQSDGSHPGAGEHEHLVHPRGSVRWIHRRCREQMRTITEGHARQHAQIDQARLLRTTHQIHLKTEDVLDALQEIPTVGASRTALVAAVTTCSTA